MGEGAVVAGVGEVSEQVMTIVAEQTGRERAVITASTEIQRDLGCSDEEIQGLLSRLKREYGIDMRGFDYDRHFESPGSLFWPLVVAIVVALPISVLLVFLVGPVLRALGFAGPLMAGVGGPFVLTYVSCVLLVGFLTVVLPRLRAPREEKIPVTVQMLIEAALLRKWPIRHLEGE
jgi:hypothetical protein